MISAELDNYPYLSLENSSDWLIISASALIA